MKQKEFVISNLFVSIEKKEILKGVSLLIRKGEVHAIMGPNGAGKTTLAMALMGHPGYKIKDQRSKIKINGENVLDKKPEERARLGLFVSFQQPIEISGVSLLAFLRTAYKSLYANEKVPLSEFKERLKAALEIVGLPQDFMGRSVNEGFSGGERKRCEMVQLIVLRPSFAILDEIDSGLDVDSLRLVAQAISVAAKKYKIGILLITHYQRILRYVKPAKVHVLMDGKIKKSGTIQLVRKIEKEGYAALLR